MTENNPDKSNQVGDNINDSTTDHEILVAYLDGELDQDTTTDIERRLTTEPELRAHLRELQQTWDMLDGLPSTEVNHSFTQSTIELVVEEAQSHLKKSKPNFAWPLKIGAAMALLVGSTAISYATVQYFLETPNRKLIRDLVFYENVDGYGMIPNISVLENLHNSAILPEELSDEEFANEF